MTTLSKENFILSIYVRTSILNVWRGKTRY
jgi:hypothetical protein